MVCSRQFFAPIHWICKKKILNPKCGASPCCSLCLCRNALQFPARQTCCSSSGSAKADVYCQNSSLATRFVSSLSCGILSVLCKSSNQHAQILFNFTASRVNLISSSYLGCILLFFSNLMGGFLNWGRVEFLAFSTV